jgi:NitT/TauT family transport system ATP-binding protein
MMLEIQGVSKSYYHYESRQAVQVLCDLSFRVTDGEFVCLLGPSGCGKSTLLNLAAGFIKPSAGRLLFQGREIVAPGPDRGVIFQEPTLFPWLTAVRNVEFGLQNTGVPKSERRLKALQNLQRVGLEGFADVQPHALSGGMRQRVALARVLVLEPALLLMDEPFSALDENTRERLQDELLRLWQADRKTILFVTHNVDEAAYLADRVLVMGPPPKSMVTEVRVSLPRPRRRSAFEMQVTTDRLRIELGRQPCCIPAKERSHDENGQL